MVSGGGAAASAPIRWPETNKFYTRKSLSKPSKHTTPKTRAQTPATAAAGPRAPTPPPPLLSDEEASSNHQHNPRRPEKRPLVKLTVYGNLPEDRRVIRRRLSAELDKVRDVVKKLEAHELKISSGGGAPSQLSVNEVAPTKPPVVSEVASATLGPKLSVKIPPSFGGGDAGSVVDVIEKEKRTPKANQYYRSSEFILGKDRLPSMDSHKKSKGGKKHSAGESDVGGDRLLFTDVFRSCNSILGKLMKHKFGWVFNKPVDVKGLGLHDYFIIIKHPMDLGTVKSRLAQDWYSSPMEFAEDVRLTFRNAMTYNSKGQDVHRMAEQLSSMFEEQWPAIEAKYINILRNPPQVSRKTAITPVDMRRTFERSDLVMEPMVFDTRTKQANHLVPHLGRKTALVKPKAKDLDKREMTYEEKQKLSRHLQSLPPEKLDAVVLIIKKNSNVNQSDEVIEVDIDSMDTETLWELDRFVVNFKKSLSKHKRRLERAMEARAMAQQHNQHVLQGTKPVAAELPKSNGIVGHQKDTAISSPANHGSNDDKASSGSSSSSSDSGSSSSDSESDSSSVN